MGEDRGLARLIKNISAELAVAVEDYGRDYTRVVLRRRAVGGIRWETACLVEVYDGLNWAPLTSADHSSPQALDAGRQAALDWRVEFHYRDIL